MNYAKVIMVKIYLTEADNTAKIVVDYLKNQAKVKGISIFRAIQGYGETGARAAGWIDISLDLPITIEFFDREDTIKPVIEHLQTLVKPAHIVFWEAKTN